MAKITDPDQLNIRVNSVVDADEEIEIQTGTKTIKLIVDGNLDDTAPGKLSGATAKAVYSALKEEWLNGTGSSIVRRFKFPLKMIFEGSFIWVNGWAPADDQTRDLFRDAGFQEGVTGDEYSCLISLGSFDAVADQAYYTQLAGYTEAQAVYDKTGELNENVLTFDADGLDSRTYLKSFLREQGKLYAEYDLLSEQGLSVISFQAYSFPLSNGTDLKVTTADGVISTTAPWNTMTIAYYAGVGFTTWANSTAYPANAVVLDSGRWHFTLAGGTDTSTFGDTVTWVAYEGEELIGSTYYAFNRAVDCGTGTDIEAYEFMQWSLRQVATDINTGTITDVNQDTVGVVNGDVAALLGAYVGDTLKPAGGVVLRNFDTNSTNSIVHSPITVDQGGIDDVTLVPLVTSEVPFPFVAAGNFNFSQNLDDEVNNTTFYTVYFSYILRSIDANIELSGSATVNTVLDFDTASAGTKTNLNALVTGDYVHMSGFTATTNDGLYIATENAGDTTADQIALTKQDGVTVIDEAVGQTITIDENPFESPGAVIVKDNAGPTDMSGDITAVTIGWDFDYTNNVQGGRTADSDAPIRVVAQALDGAEWIDATHTITKATGQNIAINANDERNYSNPA